MRRILRYFFAFAITAATALSVSSEPAFAGKPKGKEKEQQKKTLRVLYWNIQNGMWAGQGDNYQKFVDWINSKNPDICIFCEAAQIYYTGTADHMPNEERYLPAHWDELCARWGHQYHKVTPRRHSTSTPFGLGNYPQCITSRYPIDSITVLKGNRKADTVLVNYGGWYQIHVNGAEKPLNIVTMHLKNGKAGYAVPAEKKKQSEERYEGELHRVKELKYLMDHTIRKSEDPAGELWIMAGDYNSYSPLDNHKYRWNKASLGFTTQTYMLSESPYFDLVAESFPETFMPSCGGLRIDYFYVSKAMLNACTDVYPMRDSYTTREHSGVSKFYIPSDHYPIIADFKISKLK